MEVNIVLSVMLLVFIVSHLIRWYMDIIIIRRNYKSLHANIDSEKLRAEFYKGRVAKLEALMDKNKGLLFTGESVHVVNLNNTEGGK